ncbi:ribonuclease E/G [Planctomycetota bacterium]
MNAKQVRKKTTRKPSLKKRTEKEVKKTTSASSTGTTRSSGPERKPAKKKRTLRAKRPKDEIAAPKVAADPLAAKKQPPGKAKVGTTSPAGKGKPRTRSRFRRATTTGLSPSGRAAVDESTSESEDDLREIPHEDSRTRRMLINVVDVEEARVAILADKELIELNIETSVSEKYRGNIYKGRVMNIKESIQAAFIDFGGERNGFLHVSDVLPIYGGADGNKVRKRYRLIQDILQKGRILILQVTKEGVGNKGPAMTTYLSLPGRYLVLMPNMTRSGVSRKIENPSDRDMLRKLLHELDPPPGMGFIIRTQGLSCTEDELRRDMEYLLKLWSTIVDRCRDELAPAVLFQESDLVIRSIRDYYTPDIMEIWVDSVDSYHKVREFFRALMPEYLDRVKLYDAPEPLLQKYDIEDEIEKLNHNRVPLDSGAYLVIDQTEAMVTIDINSGGFTTIKDAELTAYNINMAAATEIPKQLRLRDLGGLVIIDFIDMRELRHRREVERELRRHMRTDKARFKVLRMSQFCLVEMTRQRLKPSKQHAMYIQCSTCKGAGILRNVEAQAIYVLRKIRDYIFREDIDRVNVVLNPAVADFLVNVKRENLLSLEQKHHKAISVTGDWSFMTGQFSIDLLKENGEKIDTIAGS